MKGHRDEAASSAIVPSPAYLRWPDLLLLPRRPRRAPGRGTPLSWREHPEARAGPRRPRVLCRGTRPDLRRSTTRTRRRRQDPERPGPPLFQIDADSGDNGARGLQEEQPTQVGGFLEVFGSHDQVDHARNEDRHRPYQGERASGLRALAYGIAHVFVCSLRLLVAILTNGAHVASLVPRQTSHHSAG